MRELYPGLWHWQARHPEWEPSEPWDPNVSSYALDEDGRLLLFDPLAPPEEILELLPQREAAIVLTAPWHERDTQTLVERFHLPVYTPTADSAQELMDTFGISAERAGDGSPDLVWLLKEGKGEARVYSATDGTLPDGLEAFPGHKRNDLVLWIPSKRAVVAGDTLADFGEGPAINERWLEYEPVTREEVAQALRPLLELPVEHLLAAHGGPFDRSALERALA